MIELIDIAGPAKTRGIAFGVTRKPEIIRCIEDWLGSLRAAGLNNPQSHLDELLDRTEFLAAIRRYAPDLLDEIDGIASGAGVELRLLLAQQLMDEEWAYRFVVKGQSETIQKCSSVAIRSTEGTTWIGQNMDLGGYTDGHQLLLRIAPHQGVPGALVYTIGGMLGLMGVNDRGIGICVNSISQLRSQTSGLPVAFFIRKLLQSRSIEGAVDLLLRVPHATSQHYLIASAGTMRAFEASADGVVEYHAPDPSRILHTNHPLAAQRKVPFDPVAEQNTIARLHSLQQRLGTGEIDLDDIKAALSSCDDPEYPVCREPDPSGNVSVLTGMIGFTTGSLISTLDSTGGHSLKSWASAGPPTRGYARFELPCGRP